MIITIQSIPHSKQRLGDVGDWVWEGDTLTIRVSDTGNEDSNFLIALHEMIEAYLCKKQGITTDQVDEFDKNFKGEGAPGEDPHCPYRDAHLSATAIERMASEELHVDWENYEARIDALYATSHE